MLTLPIKKKWFDMILSGEKKEEYREIKPYYETRFANVLFPKSKIPMDNVLLNYVSRFPNCQEFKVIFRNGYSKIPRHSLQSVCCQSERARRNGERKKEEYFILTVQEILKGSED